MNGSEKQKIREEVVKALGEACKSDLSHIATDALKELKEIKEEVFNKTS